MEARRERAEQHNIALLIASMQELTAVVSRHGEEIRELRDAQHRDARCSLDAYDAARSASATAREHAERSASALERIDARLEQLELTVFTRSTARMQANSVSQNAPQRRPEQQQQLQQQQQQRAHQLCSPDDFAAAAREPSSRTSVSTRGLESLRRHVASWLNSRSVPNRILETYRSDESRTKRESILWLGRRRGRAPLRTRRTALAAPLLGTFPRRFSPWTLWNLE